MNPEVPNNKLSVYLIKERYSSYADILKNADALTARQIDGVGVLYYGESHAFRPSWVEKFFGDELSNEKGIFSASTKAILLTEVKVNHGKQRIFAIPFGYGWTLLNPGTYEERFGLKVTLNVIDSAGLRQINKKNLASIPKDTREQLSRAGLAADFAIDIEQDLILAMTGVSKEENYGKTITGKDALSVTAKVNMTNIQLFLKDCFDKYQSNAYKKDFGWIDQISEVKDPKVVKRLNGQLIEKIRNKELEKIWMAVPEIIEWAEIGGFAYKNKNEDLKDDIRLSDFLDVLPKKQQDDIKLEIFERKRIYCFSAASDEQRYGPWKAYNCLYCEIYDEEQNNTYLLNNGKWYEVENDFAAQVNSDYQTLRDAQVSLALPVYNHKNENEYNEKVAQENEDFCCMDCKTISFGGGYSRVEFCDLFTKDNRIIHIKHYGGSSVLSHLFSQGVVSGELFLAEKEFRHKLNNKLPESHKIINPDTKPDPSNYQVVFAIISSVSEPLEIPFFSKVTLRNAKRRLETYGYNVSLQKISIERANNS